MREVIYHPKVPAEVRNIIADYESVSPTLAHRFWVELSEAIEGARVNPLIHHFDASGKRRCNLEKFPYHFLYRVFDSSIRITIVRHHSRNPNLGARRN